jgi:signal transduction histidine kinase
VHIAPLDYVAGVARTRLFLSTYGIDALVVLTAAWSAAGTALRDDLDPATGVVRSFEVVAVAGVVLLLLLRRSMPFAAPAGMWFASTALSFVDGRLIPGQPGVFLAGLGGAIVLGGLRREVQARGGLLIVLGGAATIMFNEPTHETGDLVFTPVMFGIGWLVGYALRERAAQTEAAQERATRAERDRETAARVAVAEERTRIARELHDVVAHAVSVMVLQVGAVRHGMPETQAEHREALENVERAGRSALAEMRRLLGAMRRDGEHLEFVPSPGLASLESLLKDVRAAGLPVALQIHGEPFELPPGLDLSAYRVVQEALTNTLKHAQAHQAEVHVHYGSSDLRVEVRDDGHGPAAAGSRGHGLVGIGERVKIYGGEMSAGGSAGGGFRVCARFPLDGDRW